MIEISDMHESEILEERQSVLIVDDMLTNRAILKKILADEYDIIEAEDGKEAWDILSDGSRNIGAVLTDIVMPVMDGYGLLKKIQQASMSELPIIVMTGEHNVEYEKKALDAGAWDFVTKPYDATILRSRLRNAMARRQVSVYQKMRQMATHDALTGLHNRARTFKEAMELREKYPELTFAFYRVDIDNFKLYNTSFGEEEGDNLLCVLADIFKEISKMFPICAFGRVGADIFCACVPYSGSADRLQELVGQSQKTLSEYRKNYLLELSVGVYVINDKDATMEDCYVRATMAVQGCKKVYGKHIAYYDEKEGKKAREELFITNEMEAALQNQEYRVYLQPKVNLETNRVDGAEALVRWQHPTKGLISPGIFIPVFERNGFISKVDYFVWERSCQYLRKWIDSGHDPVPISVNISRISLYNPKLGEELVELVERYQLEKSLLQLEITESAYMTNPELMLNTIKKLRKAGFTILMDDFGSGYSSLNTLKDIEVDILKIDMKFLPVGENVKKAEIILASMIKMANWLGMSVVVEGVETKEQRDFLESTSCRYIQGYYFARPMPMEEYEKEYVFCEKIFALESQNEEYEIDDDHVILVVDENEMDRGVLKSFLDDTYCVHTCSSAEEALLYLKRNPDKVKLILVDPILQGMSGMDFLRYCQDDSVLSHIPQIMITANDNVEVQINAFKQGVYDFIAKPLFKEVILARVSHGMNAYNSNSNVS
ncbi:MAG: EAL domain-containing protein [Hespellia sp.]|nr:EAL domain-containing protein [Hespellia sp.]